MKANLKKAFEELKKIKPRKFKQSVDIIINLKKYNIKKNPINILISLPHRIKEKKIGAFLEVENKNVFTITPTQFKSYSDKKEMKKLVRDFDFFIAQEKLMPKIATKFGRALGSSGKMPSPQLGIILNSDDKTINGLKDKINSSLKIKVKESSIKTAIGKENMPTEELVENAIAFYEAIEKKLPLGKMNIKNFKVKLSMSKPIKIE